MEPIEYARMAAVEETMWWYRALHRNLVNALIRYLPKREGRLLDAGCGTGGFMRYLKKEMPTLAVCGIDASAEACRFTRERGGEKIAQASINQLPFAGGKFNAIVSADVMGHRQVEPETALKEFHRCLGPGGVLILQLPAYNWLHSYHDDRVYNVRRFQLGSISKMVEKGGFTIDWSSYWNSIPFPLLLVHRFVLRPKPGESDVHNYSKPVESFLSTLMSWEESHLKRGGRFGFGSSILVVCHKK